MIYRIYMKLKIQKIKKEKHISTKNKTYKKTQNK